MNDDTILRNAIADAERQVKKKKRQVFEPAKKQSTKPVKAVKTTKKKLTTLELFRKKKQLGKNTEAQNLLRKPTKDRDKPHLLTAQQDVMHQADLLFLPKDTQTVAVKGKRKQITYRYALVVVDTSTSKTDAVPLATKKAAEVLQGLKTIYNRPKKKRILDRPSGMMQVVRCVTEGFSGGGARMPARSVCLVTLSLSEAGPGRFGRQVSVTDIYHTIQPAAIGSSPQPRVLQHRSITQARPDTI